MNSQNSLKQTGKRLMKCRTDENEKEKIMIKPVNFSDRKKCSLKNFKFDLCIISYNFYMVYQNKIK